MNQKGKASDMLDAFALEVGAPGFEPGTSCAQGRRASRAALRPDGLLAQLTAHVERTTRYESCADEATCPPVLYLPLDPFTFQPLLRAHISQSGSVLKRFVRCSNVAHLLVQHSEIDVALRVR